MTTPLHAVIAAMDVDTVTVLFVWLDGTPHAASELIDDIVSCHEVALLANGTLSRLDSRAAHKATVGISGKREWTPAEKARDGVDKRNAGKVTMGDYALLACGDIVLTMFADATGRNNRILRRYAVSGPNLDQEFATITAAQRAFDKAVKEAGNASP